jgi:hypothetical protein
MILRFKKTESLLEKLIIIVISSLLLANIVYTSSQTSFSVQITPGPQCYDGQDNDNDGLEDFPNDPDCDSTSDDTESDVPVGGGGGGGGGTPAPVPVIIPTTSAIFSGKAYPQSTVTLLKDAQVAAETKALSDASFQFTLSGLTPGVYYFSLYSEDRYGRRSTLLSFPANLALGSTTQISGIFIAPTIDIDKDVVKVGESIAIFGQTFPNSDVTILLSSDAERSVKTKADSTGTYLFNFNTTGLNEGDYVVKSKASIASEFSSIGKVLGFRIGAESIVKKPVGSSRGDFNSDGRVNLVDFSMLAYWYKRPLTDTFKLLESKQLNNDGKVDLVDFSILAFHWTG